MVIDGLCQQVAVRVASAKEKWRARYARHDVVRRKRFYWINTIENHGT